MKKVITLLWVFLCLTPSIAQDDKAKTGAAKPDFSGTWTLDKSKSQMGRMDQGQAAGADVTLTISHKDPELKITRKVKVNGRELAQELTYFTDGRGETNPAAFGNSNVKTKTKWDGNKPVSKGTITIIPRSTSEPVFIDVVEKREMSGDGKTLVINTFFSTPSGNEVVKQVFNRAP